MESRCVWILRHASFSGQVRVRRPFLRVVVCGIALLTAACPSSKGGNSKNASLDRAFGDKGQFELAINQRAEGNAIAIQSDGRILVGGDIGVVRLRLNGTLDRSFGAKGRVATPEPVKFLGTDANGRLVTAGSASPEPSHQDNSAVVIRRYDRTGRPDATFGRNGQAVIDLDPRHDGPAGVWIDPDGGVLAAVETGSKSAAVRLTSNGDLDPAFGANGTITADVQGSAFRDDRGQLYFSGVDAVGQAPQQTTHVVRILPRDNSVVTTEFPLAATLFAGDRSGRLLGIETRGTGQAGRHFLVRLESGGSPDASFASGEDTFLSGGATSIVLDRQQRIVVTCDEDAGPGTVRRFLPNGQPDLSFGRAGVASFGAGRTTPRSVGIQRDGKIVAVGIRESFLGSGSTARFPSALLVERYLRRNR